ncbi:unnamed protein product [Linum trigynum]|uniref:Uncharacterized protein n=1 Tax=Linum trigynum TaxID=586398 RepID=A0AAV2CIW4_9ROSI
MRKGRGDDLATVAGRGWLWQAAVAAGNGSVIGAQRQEKVGRRQEDDNINLGGGRRRSDVIAWRSPRGERRRRQWDGGGGLCAFRQGV